MSNRPSLLYTAQVEHLRAIPDLVTEMDGDPANIYAFEDEYPTPVDIDTAIQEMIAPALMVVWDGSSRGPSNFQVYTHRFTWYFRPAGKATRLREVSLFGVPELPSNLAGFRMFEIDDLIPALHHMDIPSFDRLPFRVGDVRFDLWAVRAHFAEKGDEEG